MEDLVRYPSGQLSTQPVPFKNLPALHTRQVAALQDLQLASAHYVHVFPLNTK